MGVVHDVTFYVIKQIEFSSAVRVHVHSVQQKSSGRNFLSSKAEVT
jgi:hypothetical protein